MPKFRKSYLSFILVSSFLFVFFASPVLAAKPESPGNSDNAKKVKVEKKLKDYEKPNQVDTLRGSDNAQLHKKKIETVIEELDVVSTSEETIGNTEVSEEIDEVVDEEEVVVDNVADSIEEVESRGKFQTMLFGSDYKNLGNLRSALVHNRNQIRKLTKTSENVWGEENQLQLQEQLATLTQERERIKDVIVENERQFSLLGWVFRFLSGYPAEPIDETAEEELIDEVEEVVDDIVVDDTGASTEVPVDEALVEEQEVQ